MAAIATPVPAVVSVLTMLVVSSFAFRCPAMLSFLSLVAALMFEQWRPLADRRYLIAPLARYTEFLERLFNAGESHHGVIAWLLFVGPAALATWLVYWLFAHLGPLAALAFNVATLYLTMGFRQFSHYFTDIHLALKEDDLPRARQILSVWRQHSCEDFTREEVVRLTIEAALTASHRNVFAVVFWFVLLPGPSGAVLYKLASYASHRWGNLETSQHPELVLFGKFSRNAFTILEWLPARVTAVAFAIVGDFEDAIYCWRSQASKWADRALGIVLASGAGALGVRLGMPILKTAIVLDRPELGLGDEADTPFLDSTVGLVWRALVLYLLMLLLLGVAAAVG